MHSRQWCVHLLQQASRPCIRALHGWLDFCLHTWLGMPARNMHNHNQWPCLQEGSGPKMVSISKSTLDMLAAQDMVKFNLLSCHLASPCLQSCC